MKCKLLFLLLALPLLPSAQTQQQAPTSPREGWYTGLSGGVPLAFSTFSSFGGDRTRAGWTVGVYGGYAFNSILSLEAQAAWGRVSLGAQSCCIEKNYWLGNDGNRYNSPVAGMEGYEYGDLKSDVRLQRYGLQLNVNMLGFFEYTRYSRWTVELSPLLAAVRTKATAKTIADKKEVLPGDAMWHLGAGGNLQVGYRITHNLHIGIYSGLTYLSGRRLDGIPEYRHENNYLWESGVKLGWRFGRRGKKTTALPTVVTSPPPAVCTVCAEPAETPETPAEIKTTTPPVEQPSEDRTDSVAVVAESIDFPTIFFAFNSARIGNKELPKLQEILGLLTEHAQMQITLEGWCDTAGNTSVNKRISLQRAQSVKVWLVRQGIDASRIVVAGNGSDKHQSEAAVARRVETSKTQR